MRSLMNVNRSRVLRLLTSVVAAGALVAGFATAASASPSASPTANPDTSHGKGNVARVCGTAKSHQARCFAELRTDVHGGKGVRGAAAASGTTAAAALPQGLGPSDLR